MFPIIDRKRTGIRLRRIMDERGLSVKDVQQYLELGKCSECLSLAEWT